MSITRACVAAVFACAAVVTGCAGDADDSTFEPRGEVDSSPAGNSGGEGTVVRVDTGEWSSDVMVPTLVEYLEARQASMRERRIVPAMVETATFQWVQQQRSVIAKAQKRGWTVPAKARMRVVGLDSGSNDAIVRVCMWGPSVDFVDAETGEPVQPRKRQWYPFDVKMVMAGERWYVAAAAEGEFGCEVDEG